MEKTTEEVSTLKSGDKTSLALEVGEGITQQQFETDMVHVFEAQQQTWDNAHK